MLTGIMGKDSAEVEGPPSGDEWQSAEVDTPEWDGKAWSLVEGVGSFILFDSPSSQSVQEAGIWLRQTLCQTSLPVMHHHVGFQWLNGLMPF